MLFVKPDKTLPVSLTGRECVLNCKHCGGYYLKSMSDPSRFPEAIKAGKRSFLLSGGLAEGMRVPWEAHLEMLMAMKSRYGIRYNVHTGPVVDSRSLDSLVKLADVVSFDVVGNPETMREVYGVDTWRASVDTLELLANSGIKVVPHVTVGLTGGAMYHEKDAVRIISDLGLRHVVFLVFIPTSGTAYANAPLLAIEELGDFFLTVSVRKTLGCMIPRGRYRMKLQKMALKTGFVGIVKPVPEIERLLAAKGANNYTVAEECCAFYC